MIDGKKAASHKKFTDEVIKNLFDYREDEDKNVNALTSEMVEHLNKVLLVEGSKIENI